MFGTELFWTAYILALTALLGLVMGSFLTCFAWRLAHGESVLRGRSHCDSCGHALGVLDLVPVLSWLFLKGKCRYCGTKVSANSTVVELLTALVYLSLVLTYGLSWEALRFVVLASILIPAALVDLDIGELPNGLTLAGVIWFVLSALLRPAALPGALLTGLTGGLALFLPLLVLVLVADKVLGRETMGGGDLKLFFMVGLYFHWSVGLLLLILSCLLGLLFAALVAKAKPGNPFPFGPAIAAATWLTMLVGQPLVSWYLALFL